jgi:hypothetical protein
MQQQQLRDVASGEPRCERSIGVGSEGAPPPQRAQHSQQRLGECHQLIDTFFQGHFAGEQGRRTPPQEFERMLAQLNEKLRTVYHSQGQPLLEQVASRKASGAFEQKQQQPPLSDQQQQQQPLSDQQQQQSDLQQK